MFNVKDRVRRTNTSVAGVVTNKYSLEDFPKVNLYDVLFDNSSDEIKGLVEEELERTGELVVPECPHCHSSDFLTQWSVEVQQYIYECNDCLSLFNIDSKTGDTVLIVSGLAKRDLAEMSSVK